MNYCLRIIKFIDLKDVCDVEIVSIRLNYINFFNIT